VKRSLPALALASTAALSLAAVAAIGNLPAASAAGAGPTATIGLYEEPANLNPILGPSMTFSSLVEGPMMPNLFALSPTGQLIPDLATVVPTVANGGISANGLRYTIHLRPGVKWSDGVPFTAADVIETWKLLVNPAVNAVTTQGFTDIVNAAAPNPSTVVFTLKQAYAPFLSTCWSNAMTAIVPAHVFDKIPAAQVNTSSYNTDPQPTLGPYEFVSWKHGASIVEQANPLYWGPKPKIQTLVFQVIPDQNTLLSAIEAGNINLYYFVPVTQYSTLTKLPNVRTYVYSAPAWEWAQLNLHDPVLQNVNVRRALEYAINRAAIVKYVWHGMASLTADSQVPSEWSFDPAIRPYPYSPATAEKLLDAAGWKMGAGGVRYKDGKPLVLTYSTTAGNPWRAETEQIVQQELGQIGVKVVIQNYPANTFFGTILYHGKFQIAEYEATGGPDPDLRTWRADSCSAFPPYGSNYGFWCNNTVSSLLTQEEGMTSQAARKAIFNRISAIENAEMPSLYYYSPKSIDATFHLTGYVPNPFAPVTAEAGQWSIAP
jgi:peptide/nickel transport system substrate-binding protein